MAKIKIMVELHVWCEDAREFDNLVTMIQREPIMEFENGRHCGYGFDVLVNEVNINKVRKALGFKKSDVTDHNE